MNTETEPEEGRPPAVPSRSYDLVDLGFATASGIVSGYTHVPNKSEDIYPPLSPHQREMCTKVIMLSSLLKRKNARTEIFDTPVLMARSLLKGDIPKKDVRSTYAVMQVLMYDIFLAWGANRANLFSCIDIPVAIKGKYSL